MLSLICLPVALFASQSKEIDYSYTWQIINERCYDAALYELCCFDKTTAENEIHAWLMRLYIAEKLQDKNLKTECMKQIHKISKHTYGGL